MSTRQPNETAEQYLTRLEAENAALKEKDQKRSTISLKVSEKGAVSVYGLGRFPVTLYGQQMTRLLDHGEAIRAFMVENARKLATKE
jgi:hypothetical protein